jgi:hypothetical protein
MLERRRLIQEERQKIAERKRMGKHIREVKIRVA